MPQPQRTPCNGFCRALAVVSAGCLLAALIAVWRISRAVFPGYRLDFDEAVERMIYPWLDYGPQGSQPLLTPADLRERFAVLLRAALGGDG